MDSLREAFWTAAREKNDAVAAALLEGLLQKCQEFSDDPLVRIYCRGDTAKKLLLEFIEKSGYDPMVVPITAQKLCDAVVSCWIEVAGTYDHDFHGAIACAGLTASEVALLMAKSVRAHVGKYTHAIREWRFVRHYKGTVPDAVIRVLAHSIVRKSDGAEVLAMLKAHAA